MKASKFLTLRYLFIILTTILVVGAGLFWSSAWVFERNVVRAEIIEGVREESGIFLAVKDRRIDRLAVRASRNGLLYAIEDHFLYVSEDQGESFHKRGVLPKAEPTLKDRVINLVARHPLVRNLRVNRGPANVVVLSTGTVLVFFDRIYRSEDGGFTFEIVHHGEIEGVSGPFPHGIATDNHDQVYFGEYRTDPRPQSIRVVVGKNDGKDWLICHTFQSGQVFHVHSVTYDQYANRLLIATGDQDDESGLFLLDPDCNSVEQIGGGNQEWRIIAPLFTPDLVVWGSDDDRDGAQIFSKARGGRTLKSHIFIGKPAYFGTRLSDGTFVQSTAFEPNSVFTRSALPEQTATLWISPDGFQWWILDDFSWQEVVHSWGLSRAHASVIAASGPDPYLFVTPASTEDGFVTYRYRIEWHEEVIEN